MDLPNLLPCPSHLPTHSPSPKLLQGAKVSPLPVDEHGDDWLEKMPKWPFFPVNKAQAQACEKAKNKKQKTKKQPNMRARLRDAG